jgi:hypothetical protein
MVLLHDIVTYAGKQHVLPGHTIDRPEEKDEIKRHFEDLGHNAQSILESLDAIAPPCLSIARGVWWLTIIHPTKVLVYTDRIIYIRRFLFFRRLFRHERAVMLRHIREVESDVGIFSTRLIFRTHRCAEIFRVRFLYKTHAHKATRIIQALIHNELNHGSVPSGDDMT